MMTFRKLAAASAGKLLRAYFTENTPEPAHDPDVTPGRHLDPGGRLTAYYTGRDSRATWRPDMPQAVADALGIDPSRMPKDEQLDRLFDPTVTSVTLDTLRRAASAVGRTLRIELA